jgi:hypothetical protein
MYFPNFKISYVSGAYISTMFCIFTNILNNFDCWNIFLFILILADNYLFAYVFLLYFPLGLGGILPKVSDPTSSGQGIRIKKWT